MTDSFYESIQLMAKNVDNWVHQYDNKFIV